jgi:NhaA family Na+:H+ antiporter
LVLGTVAGVGFTMSLFIGQLAFADEHLLAAAKLGVLGASVVAALLGLSLGWVLLATVPAPGGSQEATDAGRLADTGRPTDA